MVGIRFGGGRDELLTFMQYLGVITPPTYLYLGVVFAFVFASLYCKTEVQDIWSVLQKIQSDKPSILAVKNCSLQVLIVFTLSEIVFYSGKSAQ